MANVIGEFVAKIGADTGKFNKGVDKADTRMGRFAKNVKKHGKVIALAFIAMGAAAAAAAGKMVKDFAAAGDEVQKMALRTGFSTEALSELRHAAELSGTSIQGIAKAVKRMATTLLDAEQGLSTAVDAMNELNLTIKDFEGLSPEQAFEKFLFAITSLEDPLKRAAVAQDIFGRAGVDLIPIMADGVDGLKAMRQEAHELGIVFDQEAANAAAKFNDDMTRLGGTIDGIKFKIAEELIPTLNMLVVALGQLLRGEGVVLGVAAQGLTAIFEAHSKVLVEQEKAQAGLENQLLQTIQAYIKLADVQLKSGDLNMENFININTTVGILEEWLDVEEQRLRAMDEEQEKLIAGIEALFAHEAALEATVLGLKEAAKAEKELADAVIAAEAAKAAARGVQRAITAEAVIGQIFAAGDVPTAGRLEEYYRLVSAPPGDVILDGDKVGELISDRLGEGFLGEGHMSGGEP